MSTLVIGGLLVIGVIALVGVFFVARTAATPNAESAVASPAPISSQPAHEQETRPTPELSETSTLPSQPAFHDEEEPILYRIRGEKEEEPLTVKLNGQFHELANGLRVLRQQSAEMEQRLSSLTLMLDTIEQKQRDKE